MSRYQGPALIVLPNGRELHVTANLGKVALSGGRVDWSGTLSAPSSSQPIEMTDLQEGVLRVDGHEGRFVRPDISDWLGSPAGLFQIAILGDGEPPF